MTKAWCIAGLPGSGKTFLANRLVVELGNARLFDDIAFVSQLPENGTVNHVIITDPNFCIDHVRQSADRFLNARYDAVEWIFFENAPEKCLANVKHRDDGRPVTELIRFLAPIYRPEGKVRPIWQP